MIGIIVNGETIQAEEGTSVAAALLNHEIRSFRTSVSGEPRQPLCGMGVCFECRVTINDEPHQRSCLIKVREGMSVITGG